MIKSDIIYRSLLVAMFAAVLSVTTAQSKKEQLILLSDKIDSLTLILVDERENFNDEINQKNIEIKQLETEKASLISKIVEINKGKLIVERQLTSFRDSVDNLIQKIEKLNSEKPNSHLRDTLDFETFIRHFLLSTYSEKNIDSLIYVSSPQVNEFIDDEIGFGRFWNLGASCNLYKSRPFGYHFYEGYFGKKGPNISDLPFFENKRPEGGLCNKASSSDGVYFRPIDELPRDVAATKSEVTHSPLVLKSLTKMLVQVQADNWIAKTFYFVEFNDKWILLYIYDCDCST